MPLVVALCLIGIWQAIVSINHTPGYLFPSPGAVWDAVIHQRALRSASLVTGREILLGYLVAVVVGVAFAVAMHGSRICRQALYPLLVFSQTVPTVLLAPILVVAFGFGLTPKLVVIAVVCFFPIVVNTYDGLRSTDADLARMLKTLHGTRWIAFRKLEVPTALPSLFSGARVAATYAAVAAVFAEWTGSQGGLGYVMLQAGPSLETDTVVAAVLILALMALVLGSAVSVAQRLIAPWSLERGNA